MHEHWRQPPYAPTSVGALMDPEFLRRAVTDAEDFHPLHVPAATPSDLKRRWRIAVRAVATALRGY